MRKTDTLDSQTMLSALEPDQLVSAKKQPLPRRSLRPWQSFMLWLLRLYLVAVMGILIYQVVNR